MTLYILIFNRSSKIVFLKLWNLANFYKSTLLLTYYSLPNLLHVSNALNISTKNWYLLYDKSLAGIEEENGSIHSSKIFFFNVMNKCIAPSWAVFAKTLTALKRCISRSSIFTNVFLSLFLFQKWNAFLLAFLSWKKEHGRSSFQAEGMRFTFL